MSTSPFGIPDVGDASFADGTASVGDPGGAAGGSGSGVPIINSFTSSTSVSTPGADVTLSADVTGATTLLVNPDVGVVFAWPVTVTPNTTTTYTLVATNAVGSASASLTISVAGPAARNIRYHQTRRDDRLGDGHHIQMSAEGNPGTPNYPAVYDTSQNVVATQPRGTTSVVQMASQVGGYTPGNLAAFDAFGNIVDGGIGGGAGGGIYHIVFQFVGVPNDGQVVGVFTMPADLDPDGVTFPDGFAHSRGTCDANPTAIATYIFTRIRGGVSSTFCIMTVDTTGVITFAPSGDTSLVGGDRLVQTAPSPADVTLSSVSATLAGVR